MFIISLALNESVIMNVDAVVFLVEDYIGQIDAVPYLDRFMKVKA